MKIWFTRYALTSGITVHDAKPTHSPAMLKLKDGLYAHGEGKEWHRTQLEAIQRAELMRTKKLVSLRKQVQTLEKLTFPENP